VAGIGTSGTVMGNARRLREFNPDIQIVEVEPADELQIIEGLKHMETAIVPSIYDPSCANRRIKVAAEDAYACALDLARGQGVFVGLSGGAAVYAAFQLARELEHGVIVTILPDSGERYLSTVSWE
jgi:cysteine synthase B